MATFTCPRCGNSFQAKADLAVCDGSDVGAAGLTDNLDALSFPTATANWGTVVAVGIFDAATAGNLLFYGNLSVSKAVNIDDTAKLNIGALDISIA